MHTTNLRQSGGSVIVTLPKTLLDQLGLKAGMPVNIEIIEEKIVIGIRKASRAGLETRLAKCNFDQPVSESEREWLDAPAIGIELL